MKTLWLLRHATASEGAASMADRDRPLADSGRRDAQKMSERWSRRHAAPDLILSSPAARASATATIAAGAFDCDASTLAIDARLYDATLDTLIRITEALDDNLDHVVLVGHNPGLTQLAHRFSPAILHLPTCALAQFTFDRGAWPGIAQARPAAAIVESPGDSSA